MKTKLHYVRCLTDRKPMFTYIGPPSYTEYRGVEYLNQFGVFDIESSSYIKNETTYATMYVNQFCVNSNVIYNRTWQGFLDLINEIIDQYNLSLNRRFIIFIHNLSYEFQWFRKYFDWESVFARESGEPIRALTKSGIEFRCTLALTNMSLAVLGQVRNYDVKKAVGNLDYSKKRFSWTPLTEDELIYTDNDVLVIEEFVKEEIKKNGGLPWIPYTKTSYVRQLMRKKCYESANGRKFGQMIHELNITSEHEYKFMCSAFQGGFAHANAFRVNKVYNNVQSMDLTSSYPAVMVAELYPMSTGRPVQLDEAEYSRLIVTDCLIFEITFYNIRAITLADHPISSSKCTNLINADIDNGRVVSAEQLTTIITNVDMDIYKLFYIWDRIEFGEGYRYHAAPLPKPIIEALMTLYSDKTTLKGVEGKDAEYLSAKEQCNSAYGMMVTKIFVKEIKYDEDWKEVPLNLSEELKKYNEKKRRFLFYPWGVFITAYARRNLLRTIYELDSDYIYSDTDSVKYLNPQNHIQYFDNYNQRITKKIKYMLQRQKINPDLASPLDIKGKPHPLGEWTDEGTLLQFKTLGSKRYAYYTAASAYDLQQNPKVCRDLNNQKVCFHVTVAGSNKRATAEYLNNLPDPLASFADGMYISPEYAGRNYALYIDEPQEDTETDYLGNTGHWEEQSSVAIFPQSYHANISKQFSEYLLSLSSSELLDLFAEM